MKIRKTLAGLGVGALLTTGLVAANVETASAAVDTKICYSSDSTDHHSLRIWIIGSNAWYTVQYGTCGPWLSNSIDQLRVNTCPEGNYISYYQIKSEGGSYGPKHTGGCNSGSNPPNTNGYVWYKMMN